MSMKSIRPSDLCLVAILIGVSLPSMTLAEDSPQAKDSKTVIRIEEDWTYEVLNPMPTEDLPWCVTTVDFGGKPGVQFSMDVNCAHDPEFSPGGYQLRIARQSEELVHKRTNKGRRLSMPMEKISWTTVIQKSDNGFFFGLLNGRSKTWGKFGGATSFVFLSYEDAGIATLDSYSEKNSIDHAELSESKKPLAMLKLARVRIFYEGESDPREIDLNAKIEQ